MGVGRPAGPRLCRQWPMPAACIVPWRRGPDPEPNPVADPPGSFMPGGRSRVTTKLRVYDHFDGKKKDVARIDF